MAEVLKASAISRPYRLRIGGQQANVYFAGIVGGTIGLYQFNVVIPNAQSLVITIGQ